MPEITLAHLSDLHLPHDRLRIPARALLNKRMTSQISWRCKRRFLHDRAVADAVAADIRAMAPDVVALTGDLTNLGLPAECRQAAEWLHTRLPGPICAIPGNHDMLVRESWSETLGQWAPWMAADADGFPYLRHIGPLALIGVNSARPMAWFSAAGRIGASQAARLADILHEAGRQGRFRVVMIHHPPITGLVSHRKSLLDAGLFAAAIARTGAEMVLHGHAHISCMSTLPGPEGLVPVLGIASASMHARRQERAAAWHRIGVAATTRGYRAEIRRRIVAPGHAVRELPCWSIETERAARVRF